MRRPFISNTGGILVTGSTGQVGAAIVQALVPFSETIGPIHAPNRSALNLANPASIRQIVRDLKPRWIVNPAAYTAVDKAETNRVAAFDINAEAPRLLGEEAKRIGASVLHFSTDYVFDGSNPLPYVETDGTSPSSVYGASKLAGEQALESSGAQHIILRTSWVYGAFGKNFLLTILRLARERSEMKVVADQHGAPTSSRDLAALTVHILSSNLDLSTQGGVYHAAGRGETTWHGFAAEGVRQARELNPKASYAVMLPIPTSEYPTAAKRPANSRLNCTRLAKNLKFTFPQWQFSLRDIMAELYTLDA